MDSLHRRTLLTTLAATGVLAALPLRAQTGTIQLWHIFNLETDMIHAAIKRWNEANPGMQIEAKVLPFAQITNQLARAVATGDVPDLITINNPDNVGFALQGTLEDLTALVQQSQVIKSSQYTPYRWSTVSWRGKVYGVPRESNTLALYYNADMFKAKGLDPARPPRTWAELRSHAEKLTDSSKNVFGLGYSAIQSEEGVFQFIPVLYQSGASLNNLRSAEAVEALTFWTDLMKSGLVSRDALTRRQYDVTNTFMAGNTAMVITGPWELPRLAKEVKFDWRVTTLPVRDGKNIEASAIGGFNFAVPKGAKQRDAAFRVIEFMSQPQQVQTAWPSGRMPATNITVANPQWPQAYAVFTKQMQSARPLGPHPQWPEMSRALQAAIQESLTGVATPQAALQKAAGVIEPILQKTPLDNL
jgi:multiple sugar transport system substrate-binding protein